MDNEEFEPSSPIILQVAHGRVIPQFVSAYSLRCHSLLRNSNRTLISFAGAIFKDEKKEYSEQYRSLVVTFISLLRGNRVLEIYISMGKYLRKRYVNRLRELVNLSDIIIFEGPWQYNLVKDIIAQKFVVYDAHNVEYSLREGNKFQAKCRIIEGDLLDRADLVLAVTKRDAKTFRETYNVSESKLYFSPHVLHVSEVEWKGSQSNHIVFIGSIYSPNNSALVEIYNLAKMFPEYTFDIIGSAKSSRRLKLKNIIHHGIVDEETKDKIMSNSFIAINPVLEGSGRNLKMMDYLAHGLPILSTQIGIRGFEEYDLSGIVNIIDIEKFGEAIKVMSSDREKLRVMSENAKKVYENIIRTEGAIEPEEIILEKYRQFKDNQIQSSGKKL